jgi:DNA uptake protein ComE-like DNA-binding protein
MTACNAESGQKKLSGDKRKSFMADCLAGKPASAATTAAPTSGKPATTTTAPSQAGLIDINTANKEQLDALPQIGSARAEAIIKGRPYKSKNELLDRYIVPQNVYDAIKDKIVARQKS